MKESLIKQPSFIDYITSEQLSKLQKKRKYITFSVGKWVVRIKGKYLGRFSTLDEAIKLRDEYMKGMNDATTRL